MVATHKQQEGRAQQTSYLCPLCGAKAASFRMLAAHEIAAGCFPAALGFANRGSGL
jgi:hypothetical protein